ncbi:MAG: hypothetical protein JXX29_03950 [Deltaproteobacteria bacterium]|nr:hypothetical protein [Deltaproteobacteria bacterium]
MKKEMMRLSAGMVFICAVLMMTGCDDSSSNDEDTDDVCVPEIPAGAGAIGESCMQLEDCASGFCSVNAHTPTDPTGTCQAAPPLGDVHVLANVRDFMTDELMPGVQIKIGGALDISQNPTGYPVTDTLVSDANGYIDTVLTGASVELALGIMAVAEADGYYPTVTGLVKPEAGCGVYPAGIRNPDLKVMKESDLSALSDMLLAFDPTLETKLPLGDKGGVVGLIRHVVTGEMVAGAQIRSTSVTSNASTISTKPATPSPPTSVAAAASSSYSPPAWPKNSTPTSTTNWSPENPPPSAKPSACC